jgi:hypothetical protein
MTDGMRYGRGHPRKVPEGRVLAHNHVQHGAEWSCGINGFRWWSWPKEKKPRSFLRRNCGWSGLPHFADRDHAKSYKSGRFSGRFPIDIYLGRRLEFFDRFVHITLALRRV